MTATLESTRHAAETFTIARTFDAPRDLVWAVFTQPEHIINWWSSPGTTCVSCDMDLRPGGVFHYALKAEDGAIMWGKWLIQEVTPPETVRAITSFSDENRGTTRHAMAPEWPLETYAEMLFSEPAAGKTTMTIHWTPYNASEVERALFAASHDSMNGGWGVTLGNLQTYLATLTK